MARIVGVEIPNEKRIDIALTAIYGIGRSNVYPLLSQARIPAQKRSKDLTEDEISKLQKIVEQVQVEGDLRREILQNIKRLEDIGTYRGTRHRKHLPVRGQRTRSNARTKRGKRITIGTIRKEGAARSGTINQVKPVESKEKPA